MRNITLRILGTICLVDPRRADSFKKRLVIPLDTTFTKPEDRHIPYVEFLKNDIVSGSNLSAVYVRKPRSQQSVEYRRFELSGEVLEIPRVVTDPFIVWDSYDKHIPRMTEVAKQLDPTPRTECYDAAPDSSKFGGFLDISHGTLKAGPLDELRTEFEIQSGTIVHTIHSARFSELIFRVEPLIQVIFRKDGQAITIELNETSTDVITIGNQPLQMIENSDGSEDVRHHFALYYELADPANKPTDTPLPKKAAAIVNGCANTNWP